MRLAAAVLVLAACGAGGNNGGNTADGGMGGTDASSCAITLSFDPPMPVADPLAKIRVSSLLSGISGVPTYDWGVYFGGNMVAYTEAATDHSQIDFVAKDPGTYSVQLSIGGAVTCPSSTVQAINVQAPGANVADYRLRTRPPADEAPPQETILQVIGGTPINRPITLDPGLVCTGTVTSGSAGFPAYLRFMPAGNPDAAVEAFAGMDGSFSVRVLGTMHDVLVVPAVPGIAPRKLPWMPCGGQLVLPPADPITGSVRDAANNPLAGAKVRVEIAGVPSTLTTTAADGSFTLLAVPKTGATVDVEVTPPSGRGLPVLHATGTLDLSQPLAIRYATTNTTCDLAGIHVQRGGVDQPGAKVTIVGTRSAVGTAASATATGEIRIAATADNTGTLPATLVPRTLVDAVVEVSPGDVAVVPLDLTACATTPIDAPAIVHRTGTVQDTKLAMLTGVQVEAVPVGSLALAAMLPVQTRTIAGGMFDLPLASGGHYDLRFIDPFARGAQLVLTNLTPAQVPTSVTLPASVAVSGKVSIAGNPNPVIGASVQMLCATCSGLDAARPVGEAATDETSQYRVAVPDPGTM